MIHMEQIGEEKIKCDLGGQVRFRDGFAFGWSFGQIWGHSISC